MNKKLFIHIPKNAGTTIHSADFLRSKIILALPDIHRDKNNPKSIHHARWIDLDSNVTKNYKSFSIIRNPWSRVASRYFYALNNYNQGYDVPVDISSFEAFIETRHVWKNKPYMWHSATRGWYPAVDYVTNSNGILMCEMLPFENLDKSLCAYFSLQFPPVRYNVNTIKPGKYIDIYNRDTINIIGDWYSQDIEMFGYDFGSGPTKNYWKVDD